MRVNQDGDITIPEDELCFSCARAVNEDMMCPLIEALRTRAVRKMSSMQKIEKCGSWVEKNLLELLVDDSEED